MWPRLIAFAVCIAVLVAIFLFAGKFSARDETAIVILATLVSLVTANFLMEKFFTTPTEAFVNSFSGLVLLATSYDAFKGAGHWYYVLIAYVGAVLLLSSASMILFEWGSARARQISNQIKRTVTNIGSGKSVWFTLTISAIVASYSLTHGFPTALLFFAATMLAFDKQILAATESFFNKPLPTPELGQIIGVQSQNVFLARLLKTRSEVKLFDHVGFRYAIGSHDQKGTGVIIDRYMLDDERWIKVLRYPFESSNDLSSLSENGIIKIDDAATDFKARFVGVVDKDSTINELKFRYLASAPVLEGQILSAEANGKQLLFQIADANTNIERLEDKNEAGFIVGHAVQLGCWNANKKAFERYGWLPGVMTPVYRAALLEQPAVEDETTVGKIRDLGSAVNFNFEDGIKHHVAIVGVTGSGKSVFGRHLIRKAVANGIKVICVDLTSEYEGKLVEVKTTKLKDLLNLDEVAKQLTILGSQLSQWPNNQKADVIANATSAIRKPMREALEKFVKSDSGILIVDLPDLENTADMMDFLKHLFVCIFMAARHGVFGNQKLAIALEEAHTLVPEHNFMSTNDRRIGGVLNAISQIALQGRKYGVGLIVIAQRTANVSKTILTQCNTIFAFQQFDKTSIEFLGSYFGEFARALPLLASRDMIVVGKGVGSSVPFIATVPEIDEATPPEEDVAGQRPVVVEEDLQEAIEPPPIPHLPRGNGG